METSGFIIRSAREDNLRANRLEVTSSGITAAKACRDVFDALDEKMARGFTEKEMDELNQMLARLIDNLEREDTGLMNNMELSDLVQAKK